MDKSVPRVTVWHHEALPSDAKQLPEGQVCPSVPSTNDRFSFLHIFVPTLELITILLRNFTLKYASQSRQPFCFDVIFGRTCDIVSDQSM